MENLSNHVWQEEKFVSLVAYKYVLFQQSNSAISKAVKLTADVRFTIAGV